MNTSESHTPDTPSRPFGYWLKAADRLLAAEFATAFEREHATRRDWRILNTIDGTVSTDRPLDGHKLHRLVERGWVVADGEGWALTDDGRAAKERLGGIVDGIRSKVSDAVSDEEMATTLASLEKIARALGWDEETPLPRRHRHGFGRRHGRGHLRGFGHPFGRGHGFGPAFAEAGEHGSPDGFPGRGHGFGPDADGDRDCHRGGHDRGHGHPGDHDHGHGDHGHGHAHRGHGHGRHRAERIAQHAFERGFDAGFARGHDA